VRGEAGNRCRLRRCQEANAPCGGLKASSLVKTRQGVAELRASEVMSSGEGWFRQSSVAVKRDAQDGGKSFPIRKTSVSGTSMDAMTWRETAVRCRRQEREL